MSCRRITTEIETATRERLRNLPRSLKIPFHQSLSSFVKTEYIEGIEIIKE